MAKPKISFQVEPEDKAAIDAVTAMVRKGMPALGDQSQSLVMRAALRLGLVELARDPGRVTTVEPPTIPPPDEPKRRRGA